MADFNALLGNGNGCVCVFNTFQTDAELYTAPYKAELIASAETPEAGRVEETANSQGVFNNTANRRKYIERQIRELITKIAGTYAFKKRFFFNQTLTAQEVLGLLMGDNGMTEFLTHVDTVEMTSVADTEKFIDAMIGGTDAP